MIGDRLGKWVIYKELGRGGMGRVFLAQEELTGRQAALKVLSADLAQDNGFLSRFQREIEALGQLDHPNIVRFYEAGFENDLHFYAMEYVDGPSLDDILERDDRMPWKEVLDIALQVCPALKHVHDHGIIHRDLKPANILISSTGVVKLTDFGIAKVFAQGHLTATGGVVGTAEYLSPEQAAGKPVTKRSDLYSLGAVLYTLLTGHPPFVGQSFVDLLHKHRYAQFDPPGQVLAELPYEIDEVICQLLEKEPANRPPDCLVLGRQLDSIRRKLERKSNPTRGGTQDVGTIAENKLGVLDLEEASGPATLMSKLIRQELERQNRGGAASQLLSRWFVVVPLFILVMGILVWTFWPLGPEALYERGAELMDSKYAVDWERAWREYLEPLERDYPDHPHKAEVDGFRKKIDAFRLADSGHMPGDSQRFYQQGEKLRQEGNFVEARRKWINVATVFENVPSEKEWVGKAQQALKELDKTLADKARLAPAREALKEAMALRDQGKTEQAEAIWRGIEELYRDDPATTDMLDALKAARATGMEKKQ